MEAQQGSEDAQTQQLSSTSQHLQFCAFHIDLDHFGDPDSARPLGA